MLFKILQKIRYVILVVLFVLFPLAVFGEEQIISPNLPQENIGTVNILANISIGDAFITSREGGTFKITFTISNGQYVQPGIKYSVLLLKKENNVIVDQKIYSEILDIGENSMAEREIEYTPPAYLSGVYNLVISANNSKSLPLGDVLVDEINLVGTRPYVEIVTESCYLTVKDEPSKKKYFIELGVDILPQEELIGHCQIINHFEKNITIVPQFSTYLRSNFEDLVSEIKQDAFELAADVKKEISFPIPKAIKPHVYVASLSLLDENNNIISNSVPFRYILRGSSATIQNARMDKDYYKKREMAKITVDWAGSADNFENSRFDAGTLWENAQIKISLKNSENQKCANDYQQKIIEDDSPLKVEMPILLDCADPQLAVAIISNGNILDKADYQITSAHLPISKQKFIYQIYLFIIAVIIFIGIIFFILKSKRINTIVLLVILFFFLLMPLEFVKAITWTVGGGGGSSSTTYTANVYRVGREFGRTCPSSLICFYPGEAMGIYIRGTGGWCYNGWAAVRAYAQIDSGSLNMILSYDKEHATSGVDQARNVTLNAPSSIGTHSLAFRGDGWIGRKFGTDGGAVGWVAINFDVICRVTSWSAWTPNSNTVCSGTSFTQTRTSNCGTTQTQTTSGTKICVIPPALTLTANPTTINFGQSSTLSWSSTNTTSCTASGSWSGSKAISGSESTGNLTASKTYTLTCTGAGGSASGSATVSVSPPAGCAMTDDPNVKGWIWSENIGWVSASCNNLNSCGSVKYGINLDSATGKFSGCGWSENIGWLDFAPAAPYPSDPQIGAILNTATKKVIGWLKALNGSLTSGWDGWAKMAGANYGVTWSGCNLVGWAWGSDVLGWLSFSSQNCDPDKDGKSNGIGGCPAVGTTMSQYGITLDSCYNTPPIVTAGAVTQSDDLYCSAGTNAAFNWTFSDADGDSQTAYQIQVDNDNDFSSLTHDSNKRNSSSNTYAMPSGLLAYNTTYYWRVKVWDSGNPSAESAWDNGQPFVTALHAYPKCDFTWSPSQPTEITPVDFTDKSVPYGGTSLTAWQWTFSDAVPGSANVQNPQDVKFNSPGIKQVILKITDSDGYSCSNTKNISVKKSIKWKEIAP